VAAKSTTLLFTSARGGALCERQLTKLGHDHIVRALGKERGSCHVFRHSTATVMLSAGADVRHVQELLGHDDVRTTQRYTRVSVRELRRVHARCHPAG
jgi:integrase/recombinase XerD